MSRRSINQRPTKLGHHAFRTSSSSVLEKRIVVVCSISGASQRHLKLSCQATPGRSYAETPLRSFTVSLLYPLLHDTFILHRYLRIRSRHCQGMRTETANSQQINVLSTPQQSPPLSRRVPRHWASLPFPVICRLAHALKVLRRWRSDGPPLRLLNKHWSEAINQNIYEVRPHKNRLLVPADLVSLLKFSRLTSVDISHFVASRNSAKQQSISIPSRAQWYGKELKRIVHVLQQLPCLSRIEMSRGALLVCSHRCQGANQQWSRLRDVTSLFCYCFMNPKSFGDTVLNTMWVRQHTGRGDISRCLKQLVESLPCLQTVELQACLLGPRAKLRFMEEIPNIQLHRAESLRRMKDLPNPKTIVSSMLLRPKIPAKFDRFVDKDNVKSLGICTYKSPGHLIRESIASVLRRLQVLDLTFDTGWFSPKIPNALFYSLCRLECLNLSQCSVNGAAMLGHLCNLRALRFSSVNVMDGVVAFLSQLRRLEVLNWLHVSSRNNPVLHLPLHEALFPRLWSLCVSRMKWDRDVAHICKRTGLEVLSIHALGRHVTAAGLQKLNRLCNLRIFRVVMQGESVNRLLPRLLSLEMVERLEQLWLDIREADFLRYQNAIESLQQKFPRLIIETEDAVDYEPRQHFFENACFM